MQTDIPKIIKFWNHFSSEPVIRKNGIVVATSDGSLQKHEVEQIQTAIRGRIPSAEKLNLSDFKIKQSEGGKPTQITCPQEKTVEVHPNSQKKSFVAHFDDKVCQVCPFLQKCPVQRGKRDTRFHLRAAVEATVRQVNHPFPAGKLPVRGRFRITCMVIGSAMTANVRRIQSYLEASIKLENKQKKAQREQECSQEQLSVSFFVFLIAIFRGWRVKYSYKLLKFSY